LTTYSGGKIPDWLNFDSTEATMRGVPEEEKEFNFKLTANDLRGGTAYTTF